VLSSALLIAYIKHRNVSSFRVVFSHGSVSRSKQKNGEVALMKPINGSFTVGTTVSMAS